MNEIYKPILSQEDFNVVSGWLLENALKHKQKKVLSRIATRFPKLIRTGTYPAKHLSLARSFLEDLFKNGPLPEITNPLFCKTLLEVVGGIIATQDKLYEKLERTKVALMISGLRILLVFALLHSDKYDISDVRSCLNLYFPEDLYAAHGVHWQELKELLKIQDEDESLRKMVSLSCKSARNCVFEKLKISRLKGDGSSSLKIWDSIRPCLGVLLNYLDSTLQGQSSTLERLEHGQGALENYVLAGTGDRGEEDILAFIDDLVNLRTESEFWLWSPTYR